MGFIYDVVTTCVGKCDENFLPSVLTIGPGLKIQFGPKRSSARAGARLHCWARWLLDSLPLGSSSFRLVNERFRGMRSQCIQTSA